MSCASRMGPPVRQLWDHPEISFRFSGFAGGDRWLLLTVRGHLGDVPQPPDPTGTVRRRGEPFTVVQARPRIGPMFGVGPCVKLPLPAWQQQYLFASMR